MSTLPLSDPRLVPRRRRRSIPLGFLGTLVLIAVVEAAIMQHDDDFTTLVAANWAQAAATPARHGAAAEVLCFGDSMVKFGVQPRVLGAALGRRVYNFALYCGPPETSFYQLQRAFAAGARPAAVLVDFQPEILACDNLTVTSRTLPEILGLGELFDLCRFARNPARFGEFVVARLLPSARKRFEIREACAAALGGRSASIRDRVRAIKRNWKVNGGAEVLAKNPYYRGEIPETGAYPSMFWSPWKPNKLNVVYLERFLNLAARHHVPVVWLLQPNATAVDIRREQAGYNARYEYFVRGYQERYANLVVVDGRHVDYPAGFFVDPVHLDRSGATAYSLGIADILRPILAAGIPATSRWQVLPDRRERADEVALEDGTQSVEKLRGMTATTTPQALRR